MTTAQVRQHAHELRGSLHGDAEQRLLEMELRGDALAALISDPAQASALITAGVDYKAFAEGVLSRVYRPPELLPPHERGLGLTRLLIDSGAFSIFNSGLALDIDKYIAFLLNNRWMESHVVFDDINPRGPEAAAAQTFADYQKMCAAGLSPWPVFHIREGFDWLRRYLDLGCSTIGLSATSLASKREASPFYERSFSIIANANWQGGVHGFGEAKSEMLAQFPFTSADSASWMLHGQRYGTTSIRRFGEVPENDVFVLRTLLEARKYARLEREIRDLHPGFDFYLVANNNWLLPAMRLYGHRKGLFSFAYLTQGLADRLKNFIANPDEIMSQPPFADKLAKLEEVKARYGV
jgi:hypothetical protein